eukprot:COSAG04_NODE_160_length_22034_cov_4.774151_9_plen_145_part_00
MAERPPLDSDVRKWRRPLPPPMPRQQRCCCCSRTTAMEPCTVTSTCDNIEIDMSTNCFLKIQFGKKGRHKSASLCSSSCQSDTHPQPRTQSLHVQACAVAIFRSLRCALPYRSGVCGLAYYAFPIIRSKQTQNRPKFPIKMDLF